MVGRDVVGHEVILLEKTFLTVDIWTGKIWIDHGLLLGLLLGLCWDRIYKHLWLWALD